MRRLGGLEGELQATSRKSRWVCGPAKQDKHTETSGQSSSSIFPMAAVRLRRALHYPEDAEEEREELDEEQQEQVIQQLQRQNETRNAQYSVLIHHSPIRLLLSLHWYLRFLLGGLCRDSSGLSPGFLAIATFRRRSSGTTLVSPRVSVATGDGLYYETHAPPARS